MAKLSMQRDPRVYARGVVPKLPEHKRVLSLDLGTNCGIAYLDYVPGKPVIDAPLWLDQLDLSIGTYDTTVLRHVRLQQFLSVLDPDLVGFEDVKVDVPLDQFKGKLGALVARIVPTAEFLGTLKVVLSLWCFERNIPLQGFAITQIKKYATGKGNSGKEAMIEACNARFGTDFATEKYEQTGVDNMADAAFILAMLLDDNSEGLTDGKDDTGKAAGDSRTNRRTRRSDSAGKSGSGETATGPIE
jgi:hypothetical protein